MSWLSEFGAAITGRFAARPDLAPQPPVAAAVTAFDTQPLGNDLTPEQRVARIRERYLATRFPGFPRNWKDLADVASVVKAARIYLEGGNAARAQELLDLASEFNPGDALWLARHEVAFLVCDRAAFLRAARRFEKRHPGSPHWIRIRDLARRLGIDEAPFGDGPQDDGFGFQPQPVQALQAALPDDGQEAVALRVRMLSRPPRVGPPARVEVAR